MRIDFHPTTARVEPPGLLRAFRQHLRVPDLDAGTGWLYLSDHHTGDVWPGLTNRLYHEATARGLAPVVQDCTGEPTYTPVPVDYLYAHQAEALASLLMHRRGILHSAPRSGKTVVAAALIRSLVQHRPAVFLVEREELLTQQREVLERFVGEPCGILRGSTRELDRPVVVAMAQTVYHNLAQLAPWLRTVRLAVVDEVHHAAASSYHMILQWLTSVWRVYGLSATPWRTDGQDLLLEGNVGPVLHRVTYTQLIRSVDPETGRTFLVPPVVVFQDMPPPGECTDTNWQDVHRQAVVKHEVRNQAVIDFVEFMRSRDRTTVVLVDRIKHGRTLARRLGCPFTRGDSRSPDRQEVIDALRERDLDAVVSTLYREAVDIPSLDAVVNAGATASSIQYYQAMRNLTPHPGKHVAPVLDFVDRAPFLSAWAQDRLNFCHSEPGFVTCPRSDYMDGAPVDPDAVWGWLDPLLERGIGFN